MRVKYFQKGGGKFTATEKKIYLDHCKTLCLGREGNTIESRDYLLDKLKTDVRYFLILNGMYYFYSLPF